MEWINSTRSPKLRCKMRTPASLSHLSLSSLLSFSEMMKLVSLVKQVSKSVISVSCLDGRAHCQRVPCQPPPWLWPWPSLCCRSPPSAAKTTTPETRPSPKTRLKLSDDGPNAQTDARHRVQHGWHYNQCVLPFKRFCCIFETVSSPSIITTCFPRHLVPCGRLWPYLPPPLIVGIWQQEVTIGGGGGVGGRLTIQLMGMASRWT